MHSLNSIIKPLYLKYPEFITMANQYTQLPTPSSLINIVSRGNIADLNKFADEGGDFDGLTENVRKRVSSMCPLFAANPSIYHQDYHQIVKALIRKEDIKMTRKLLELGMSLENLTICNSTVR